MTVSFLMGGKFSAIISLNIFSGSLSLFSFWDPYNANADVFNVVPEIDGEEKAMATHSSTLAWEIPWMGEPGRLQSMGSLRVWHN